MVKKGERLDTTGKSIHIFTKISNYSEEFMDFLAKYYSLDDHLFCFREITTHQLVSHRYAAYMLSVQERGFYYLKFPKLLKASKQIILHSFPISYSLIFWLIHKRYLKKAVWSLWGFDIYWYSFCERTIKNRLFEKIRKILIPELKTILCPVYGDFLIAKELYKAKANYHKAMYPIPTGFDYLDGIQKQKPEGNDLLAIQIGNSGTATNNLIEILDKLRPLKDFPVQIYCFLNYGEKDYSDLVNKTGKTEFGEKFIPITEYLSKERYAEIVARIDVLIMNNNRQQGLGNIFTYLYLGKKVYIRDDNTSFNYFTDNGITVFDTLELFENPNYNTIQNIDLSVQNMNIRKTKEILDIHTFIREWKPILE